MNIHPKDEIILTRVNLHTFFLGVVVQQCMFNRRSEISYSFLFSFLNRIFIFWDGNRIFSQLLHLLYFPPRPHSETTRWKNFEQNFFSTPPPSSIPATTSLRTQCQWKNEKVLPPTLGVGTTTRPQRCHRPLPGSQIVHARSCTKMD